MTKAKYVLPHLSESGVRPGELYMIGTSTPSYKSNIYGTLMMEQMKKRGRFVSPDEDIITRVNDTRTAICISIEIWKELLKSMNLQIQYNSNNMHSTRIRYVKVKNSTYHFRITPNGFSISEKNDEFFSGSTDLITATNLHNSTERTYLYENMYNFISRTSTPVRNAYKEVKTSKNVTLPIIDSTDDAEAFIFQQSMITDNMADAKIVLLANMMRTLDYNFGTMQVSDFLDIHITALKEIVLQLRLENAWYYNKLSILSSEVERIVDETRTKNYWEFE